MTDTYIVTDPTTGRPILMAPKRRDRPHLAGRESTAGICPMCPGHEAETPPEVDAVREEGTAPNQPGWRVRAVPNLYPAAPFHEVVVEGPVHESRPAQLSTELWGEALEVYRRRIAFMEAQDDVRMAYWFKNVGVHAGASIAHNHTQILGLPMLAPRLELELACSRAQACVWCEEIRTAEAAGRMITLGERFAALAPRAPKLPFETWLVPVDHDTDFADETITEDLARSLHTLFGAVDRGLEEPPFNIYLHRIPGEAFHWHFELQPRVGNVAGLELGGDMYINMIPPEESAERIRSGLA